MPDRKKKKKNAFIFRAPEEPKGGTKEDRLYSWENE